MRVVHVCMIERFSHRRSAVCRSMAADTCIRSLFLELKRGLLSCDIDRCHVTKLSKKILEFVLMHVYIPSYLDCADRQFTTTNPLASP